jgi:hypothetical protein
MHHSRPPQGLDSLPLGGGEAEDSGQIRSVQAGRAGVRDEFPAPPAGPSIHDAGRGLPGEKSNLKSHDLPASEHGANGVLPEPVGNHPEGPKAICYKNNKRAEKDDFLREHGMQIAPESGSRYKLLSPSYDRHHY